MYVMCDVFAVEPHDICSRSVRPKKKEILTLHCEPTDFGNHLNS